jgi:hypothetical protein
MFETDDWADPLIIALRAFESVFTDGEALPKASRVLAVPLAPHAARGAALPVGAEVVQLRNRDDQCVARLRVRGS